MHHDRLPPPMPTVCLRRPLQRGLGVIAALLVLVVLSVLGAAIARMGWTAQVTHVQDLDSARVQQAAMAGVEWGLYQALKGSWTTCAGASQKIDLRATLGAWVVVTCNSSLYVEGEAGSGDPPTFTSKNVRTFVIDALACNGATTCPDTSMATGIGYVERRRQVQATDQ